MAGDAYPPPRFTDPQRVQKLESAIPRIDAIFRAYAAERKIPGMAWGVVIDNRLAHVATVGVRDRVSNAPVTADTAFRIASMTKSFTALAILKLRDEGKLSLEDPVAKWIPEFAKMELPTRDTPPLRVRQLLSHSAGFPEDNPWGDQQLSASEAQLDAWLKKGIPFLKLCNYLFCNPFIAYFILGSCSTAYSIESLFSSILAYQCSLWSFSMCYHAQ